MQKKRAGIGGDNMTMQQYIEPPYHFKYPRPYVPGHIRGTKREWVPCAVCTTLFIRRIDKTKHPHKTCGNNKCVDINRINSIKAWRNSPAGKAWKKQYEIDNKDVILKQRRESDKRRAKNPKRIEQRKKSSRKWAKNNKQYYKDYYQKNRLAILAKHKAKREAAKA